MENVLSLFRKQRADTSSQESSINLHSGSSNEDALRVVNIQKLFHAIEKEQTEHDKIVEIEACLKNGADLNSKNDAGNTVLDIVEQKNYQRVVEFLLERGALRGDSAPGQEQCGAGAAGLVSDGNTQHLPSAPGVSSNVFVNELSSDFKLEELVIDSKLDVDHENYISFLEEVAKDSRSINEKLKLDPYPSDHTLALLALKVYSDNPGDKTSPELPQGWELLTTASNPARTNGYFGAAFWCRGQLQVVVAHRGTAITNTGAMLTNYKSIIYGKYSPHMQSAITFTDLIASALREMKKRHGVCFQLSITGHSLGGWLSQVTTFSAKYLKKDKKTFKKVRNIRDGFHAHTVVFDSPGCRPMLSKMREKFDLRYERSIFLRRLDIRSYLSAPNRINSLNMHLGIIFRVVTDLSDVTALDERLKGYTEKTHSMKKMVQAWSGLGSPNMVQMLDWPLRSVLRGEEYKKFFIKANRENEYHQQTDRYEFKEVNRNCCSLRTFSEDELLLLDSWMILKKSKMNLTNLIKIEDLTVSDLFDEFVIDKEKQVIECTSEESLKQIIRHTKALMRWVSTEVMAATRRQVALVPSAAEAMIRAEGNNFFHSIKCSRMNFKDTLGLEDFLKSGSNILYIETPDGDMEMARFVNIFQQINKKWNLPKETNDHYIFMDVKEIKRLQCVINIKELFQSSFTEDYLFIVQCNDRSFETILNEILANLKNNPKNKLVFIDSQETEFENIVNSFCPSQDNCLIMKHTEEIELHDLTKESIKILFEQKIIFLQGEQLSLQELVGECCHLTVNQLTQVNNLIGVEMLKRLLSTDNYVIKMDVILNHNDLKVHSTLNTEVSLAKISQVLRHSHDALLVVSGIGREELGIGGWKELVHSMGEGSEERIFTSVEDGESTFKKLCREKPDSTAYWLAASAERISCKAIYEKDFYMVRRFHHIIFNLEQFARQIRIQDAIFIFLNVTDKQSLISQCLMSEENKHMFSENNNIKTVASDKEADDIIRENPDKPCHILKQVANNGPILWQRSRGSLEGLRPYVTVDRDDSMDEGDLCSMSQKLIIIADEPGMGKSTSLTSISRLLQSAWVIRVELKNCRKHIQNLPSELSLNAVCDFILSDNESMLSRLLQFCLDKQNTHSREVYLLFDGFDEVKEDDNAEDKVLRLLKYLHTETSARIWVTTRLYRREMLENGLENAFAMRFEKISESQQRGYLVMFWRSHLLLELDQCGAAEEEKLEWCARYLYNHTRNVLGDDIQQFMGIPLQMRMLAEVFMQRVEICVKSENPQKNIGKTFNVESVFELYRDFIWQKYEIYFSDKTGLNESMSKNIQRCTAEQITEKHRMLGMRTLFPEFALKYLGDLEEDWNGDLCKIGLVQSSGDNNVEFVHRTLAEYFCADWTADWLNKNGRYLGIAPIMELLLTEILSWDSHMVTRTFLNKFLQLKPLSEEAHKFNAQKISDHWLNKQHSVFNPDQYTALHVAVNERNVGIIDILMGGFKYESVQRGLTAFVAAHNREGHTALGLAARKGSNRLVMEKIVRSIEKCSYEVTLELILATYIKFTFASPDELKLLDDYLGEDIFNICSTLKKGFIRTKKIMRECISPFLEAVQGGKEEYVDLLYGQMENNTERNYMLMAPDRGGRTALHLAARHGGLPIVEYLVNKGADVNILDESGYTALFDAAASGSLRLTEYLVDGGAEINIIAKDGTTALFIAAYMGQLTVVEYLVRKGANINIIDKEGFNALFYAASSGSLPLVEYLVDRGVEINIIAKNGATAIFNAAGNGHLRVLEYLVDRGAEINIIAEIGDTALFSAAINGHLTVVEYLVDRGAECTALFYATRSGSVPLVEYINRVVEINIIAKNGDNALFYAASNDDLAVVEYLVDRGTAINIIAKNGATALSNAAFEGHLAVVEYLVDRGAEINIIAKDGCTALFCAAVNGHLSVVEYLVDRGADINIIAKDGGTALFSAAVNGHLTVVEYLVDRGAEINIIAKNGVTALSNAAIDGHLTVVEYLVGKGAKINILDKEGCTALFYAASSGSVPLVEYLVDRGAEINIFAKNGATAIFKAARNGHLTVVGYLVDRGAEINIIAKNGFTALFNAAIKGHLTVVEYLVDRGAEINIIAKTGATALSYAAIEGHLTVVEYLVGKGANINILDKEGCSALFYAASSGSVPLVEYLVNIGAEINIIAKNGDNALFYAASKGHLAVVEYLVDKGAEINIIAKDGGTALFSAAVNGHLRVVEDLVDRGADINIIAKDGGTALFSAAVNGHLTVVEYLVDRGANINILDKEGCTALFYAASSGIVPLVEYLVDRGAEINIIAKDGGTALFSAARNGHLTVVENLVDRGAEINIIAKNGYTALSYAAIEGHLTVVEYLVGKGANINILDNEGCTALFYAASSGSVPLVEYLVDRGAEINIIAKNGDNALFYAASKGHLALVEYLVDRGAEINIINKNGATALSNAAFEGHLTVVEYLVDRGAEINIIAKNGVTALSNAAIDGHLSVVEYLVGKGANINILDKEGCTALFYAASSGSVPLVEYLVDRGAEINIIARNGATALFNAARNGHLTVVEYLVDRGAEINIIAKNGATALFEATSKGNHTLVEYLIDKGAL